MKIKEKHRISWNHWYVTEAYPDGTFRKIWISKKIYREILEQCPAWEIRENVGHIDGKIYVIDEKASPISGYVVKLKYRDAEVLVIGRMADLVMEGV